MFFTHLISPVFGPVTRVICRAQDLNIWYRPGNGRPRQYLGDNREVLEKFTREEVREKITFEYDFYFGFCGSLREKDQVSREVPTKHRVSDRIVEEDVEALYDGDEKVQSFHFSSSNFYQPLMMSNTNGANDGNGAEGKSTRLEKVDFLERTSYTVVPPALGSLVCGVPVKSKRGISLAQWWTCPRAFYEFWKLLMAEHPPRHSYETMQRLRWKHGNEKFFQELALCALFNRPPARLSPECQRFFQTLNRLVSV